MKSVPPTLLFFFSLLIFNNLNAQKPKLDLQGHRGCRGLMPENSIPAFIKAIQLGVTTLEMDAVISSDKKVVISHEPWINASICLGESKAILKLQKEEELNIYKMTYEDVRKFDCGSLENKSFRLQEKIPTYKPLLSEVFDSVISYCKNNSLQIPNFNIEIKSQPDYDSIYSPGPAEYCKLVMDVITNYSLNSKCTIQSFDIRSLKYMHEHYPSMTLSFLSETKIEASEIKGLLGFIPEIYSPYKLFVTKKLIAACHSQNMKVMPWTVNDEKEINKLIEWGVDGIITDYPDKIK